MQIPFSRTDFLDVFAAYNQAIWPLQIAAVFLGVGVVLLLVWRPLRAERVIAVVLAIFWVLMGAIYHWLFFAKINKAAYFFGAVFILQGLILLIEGTVRNRMHLAIDSRPRTAVAVMLILYALVIYPLLGLLVTHPYPATPLFGVAPCPTTIFTLGVLLLMNHPRSWILAVIPLLWAIVGGSAAVLLNVPQDWGLLAALFGWFVAHRTPRIANG
jgi:hypothetical protein